MSLIIIIIIELYYNNYNSLLYIKQDYRIRNLE